MEKKIDKTTRLKKLIIFLKGNLKYIISLILILFLIFGGIEYYKYNEIKKIKNISKSYFKAIEGLYLEETDSINILNQISNTKKGYSLMASMKLVDIYLNNENFNKAYDEYMNIIDKSEIEIIYKDLVILHASYNLINNINSRKINDLIALTNIEESIFKSHFYEVKFINSINNKSLNEINKLNNYIQEDLDIIKSVKMRINKINEYLQYK